MGYARARRDLSCRYTLGFYDDNPREERAHSVRVKMNRPGLRIAFPSRYAFRAPEKKRESILTAAYIAPAMFQNGVIRTHVFPVRPHGKRSWDCTVAVEFPMPPGAGAAGLAEREFGVILRNGSRIVAGFDRKISVRTRTLDSPARRVSFSQPVELGPGSYTVTAVMTVPGEERPYTSQAQVVVPPVPGEEVFLVAPVLGKRAGRDVVVRATSDPSARGRTSDELAKEDRVGDADSVMPLLVHSLTPEDRVLATTHACVTSRYRGDGGETLGRAIESESGRVAFDWPAANLVRGAKAPLECREHLDEIPATLLEPGEYMYKAWLQYRAGSDTPPQLVPFTLRSRDENAALGGIEQGPP
ncbi:MAG TPA: hypothetical protein VFP98_08560 [Candidatus Polarisedimenticolia bacterium]|nr:hypothetical protein [Candidatus Polarisedimenticolia bacterium]